MVVGEVAPLRWIQAMVMISPEIIAASMRVGYALAAAGHDVFPIWCLSASGGTLSTRGMPFLLGAVDGPASTIRIHKYPRGADVWSRWERARCPAKAFQS